MRRKWRRYIAVLRNIIYVFVIVVCLWFFKQNKLRKNELLAKISKQELKYIIFEPIRNLKSSSITEIKEFITSKNNCERIENFDEYGPITDHTFIFVIFVDKYKISLKYLILSLSKIEGIEDSLLIFSHSLLDLNVNNLTSSIDFSRVLHIYYPYSLQIYKDQFPGFSPGDCPFDMDIEQAKKIQCTGSNTPDLHGRYRIPAQAETKHFWWWTMNKVFENLTHTKDHSGPIAFLQDDMFLTEDFIYMTLQMKTISHFVTPCDFLSLERPISLSEVEIEKSYTVEIKSWDPNNHSNMLIFDSSVWNIIASHYYLFCNFDDSSWSRSLYYLSLNRKDGDRFKIMTSSLPRAFKISAALNGRFEAYGIYDTIYRIMNIQQRIKNELYPCHLEVYYNVELEYNEFLGFDYMDNTGGWSDPRDKMMCNNFTMNKIKKVLMDMHNEFHEYNIQIDNKIEV